ncbi:MAG: hypothetical protein J2P15_01795 [Micromonosporaceae bacterium]|nr:hypothetical protein [Micromonosporaceae bacterium]
MTRSYLGVDAGNSKTVALVGDSDGKVLGWGRAGVGDIYGAPDEPTAVGNVFAAVDAALERAGAAGHRPDSATFCLAGVDWPEDGEFWQERIAQRYPGLTRFSVRNDGFATLRAGAPSGLGIAVSVGTGPAVAARGPDGTQRCLGWWCFDHLGGDGLGAAGLRAVYRSHQGLAPATTLTGHLTRLYQIDSVAELLHAFTRRADPLPRALQGRAARIVLACAAGGDPVANRIVDEQAVAFAGYAWWVGREAGFDTDREQVPVILGGSVVTSEIPALRDQLARRIAERIPGAQTTTARLPPAVGALLEAMAEDPMTGDAPRSAAGEDTLSQVRARLADGDVPLDLFTTD